MVPTCILEDDRRRKIVSWTGRGLRHKAVEMPVVDTPEFLSWRRKCWYLSEDDDGRLWNLMRSLVFQHWLLCQVTRWPVAEMFLVKVREGGWPSEVWPVSRPAKLTSLPPRSWTRLKSKTSVLLLEAVFNLVIIAITWSMLWYIACLVMLVIITRLMFTCGCGVLDTCLGGSTRICEAGLLLSLVVHLIKTKPEWCLLLDLSNKDLM